MNSNARVIIVEDDVFDAALLAEGLARGEELEKVCVSVDRGLADSAQPVPITLNRRERRRRAALARRKA